MALAFLLALFALSAMAGLGWFVAQGIGAVVAVVVSAAAWFAYDCRRAAQVLTWLRQDAAVPAPVFPGVWGDVTARAQQLFKTRAKELSDSEGRLQEFLAAIQASPNGVVLLDALGRIEWSNRTAGQHFGFDARRDLMQIITNLIRDPLFVSYYASELYSEELLIVSPTSTASVPIRIAVQLHPYGAGRSLMLSRDVTAIEQADVMRRDFVANVSHEIRTPLTVLAGFVETLQTLRLTEEERTRYLRLMRQQSERMQNLVSDLLALSKLDGSPLPSGNEWVDICSLLHACEEEAQSLSNVLRGDMRPHQLRFSAAGCQLQPGQLLQVAGARGELQSAMSNLVNNAVRYTPPGGQVDVSLFFEEQDLVFSVRDTGPGIAAEHIPRLTERFYRVDRSRSRETGGTGLGLAIVKHVVQRHRASLHITSTLGSGSEFRVVFASARVRVLQALSDDQSDVG